MYFQLECDEQRMSAYLKRENHASNSLVDGAFIDPVQEDLPFRVTYQDPTGSPLFDYYSGKNIMSRKMVDALKQAGADNFQEFATEMIDKQTGQVSHDYVTVNLLGLVSCAKISESDTSKLGSTFYFHDLVIDPAKTGGLLLFRLADSLIDVLVHEKVAIALRAANLRGVVLNPTAAR
jgi:hypothetical protein